MDRYKLKSIIMKYLSSLFLPLLFFMVLAIPQAYSQYYGYFPGYYGGCLGGVGCSGAYKAATIIGLGVDTLNFGVSEYRYHKAQEQQIQQIQYEADAARSAVNYQKQMEDYKNSGIGVYSITVYAEKPEKGKCNPETGCCD